MSSTYQYQNRNWGGKPRRSILPLPRAGLSILLPLITASCSPHAEPESLVDFLKTDAQNIDGSRERKPREDLVARASRVIPLKDAISVLYFDYPHGDDRGFRLYIRLNDRDWIETQPNGRIGRLLTHFPAHVRQSSGLIILRLDNHPDSRLEGFMPRADSRHSTAYFRVRNEGTPGPWRELGVMTVIK